MVATNPAILAGALLVAAAAPRAQEPLDLLQPWDVRTLSLYNPQVTPQVLVLRSAEQAAEFARQAWGEDKKELQLDYAREQVLVLAWGPHRWEPDKQGGSLEILLEQAVVREGTLHVVARTMIPAGPGGEVGPDDPGRTWYPSVFLRTPRTDRARVEIVGARCRDRSVDFFPVVEPDLEVRVAADSAPAREQLAYVRNVRTANAVAPRIGLFPHDEGQVLEIAWGELEPGLYRLDLTGATVQDGVARLTVRAENRAIAFYSGPPTLRPRLALALPPTTRVELHIERLGIPMEKGDPDFADQQDERLTVTVDRSRVRRP